MNQNIINSDKKKKVYLLGVHILLN